MASYIRIQLRCSLRNWAVPLTILLMALVSFLGMVPPSSWSREGYPLCRDTYEYRLDTLNYQVKLGVYDTAPEQLRAFNTREQTVLTNAVNAETSQEFYEAVSNYYGIQLEEIDAGYLVADSQQTQMLQVYASALSKMSNGVYAYAGSDECPAPYYVAWMSHMVYYTLLLIPAVASSVLVLSTRSGMRLLARAPISRRHMDMASSVVALLGSVVIAGVAWLPVIVMSAISNGFGTLAFPIVYIQSGEIVTTTLGSVLLRQIILYLLATLLFTAVACLSNACFGRVWPGAIVILLIASAPLFPVLSTDSLVVGAEAALQAAFGEATPESGGLFTILLPTSYMDIPSVAGYVTNGTVGDISTVEGATFARGCIVLLVWTVVCFALARLVRLDRRRIHQRALKGAPHA